MRHLLLCHHFGAGLSERAVYATTSGRLANPVWCVRTLFDVARVPHVPESQFHHGDSVLVLSGPAKLPHRHGSRVCRQLFRHFAGENLATIGHLRVGAFLRLDVQGDSGPAHGHLVGDFGDVGNHRDGIRTSVAQLQGVLVGCAYLGRAGVQWFGHLVRTTTVQAAGDARVSVGEHTVSEYQ